MQSEPPMPNPPTPPAPTAVADLVIEDVLELDPTDYPVDDPDTIRMSLPDLRRIVERHVTSVLAALATPEPERGALPEKSEKSESGEQAADETSGDEPTRALARIFDRIAARY